jgi:hypothetical protein
MNLRLKWLLSGGVGALLFGSGLSIAMECSHLKQGDGPLWLWIVGGTIGIGITLSGVVILIKTAFIEQKLKEDRSKKRS